MSHSPWNKGVLLVVSLSGSLFLTSARGQQASSLTPPIQAASIAAAKVAITPASDPAGWHARQGLYFKRKWGVDIVDVRLVASGEMLAFRYVVLDPEKAAALNETRNTAYLVDEKSGRKLMVPQMEKIGVLRTTAAPKAGRMYWMLFANTGDFVKVGSTVDVVIGAFSATGLTVDSK